MDVNSLVGCSICGETVAEEETTMAFGDVVCDRCNAKYNRAKAKPQGQDNMATTASYDNDGIAVPVVSNTQP